MTSGHPRLTCCMSLAILGLVSASSLLAANEYQIDLTVDPVKGTLHGVEKIVYKNETEAPLDALTLEAPGLPGNPPMSGNERWRIFSLMDAKGKNVPLTWKAEEEVYRASLSSALEAGFKTTFVLEYERPIAPIETSSGYLNLPDKEAGTWYVKARAYRAGSFGSDDFKDVTVKLMLPAGWSAASTGAPPAKPPAGSAGRILLAAKGVRNFALAFSDRFKTTRGTAGSIPLTAYYLEGQESWAAQALAETAEAVTYYTSLLGVYPAPQVAILPAGPGDDAGSSSAHVLYAPTSGGEGGLRAAISFEAARQIWGWAAGDPSDVTPFIGNGLSAWCQQNFLAKKNGLDLHAQFLASGINDIYLTGALRGYDTTLIRTRAERARFDWDFDRIVARAKSAAVIHMLGNLVGEEKFLEVLKGILKTNPKQILGDRDLQRLAQAATPSKLDGFFDEWLRAKDTLDYYLSHVRTAKTEAGFEVHADVWKTGTAAMPVEILVESTNGEKVRSIFPADRTSGEMVIPMKGPLASITLDPRNILPMISRVGTRGRLDLAESLLVEGKLLRADEQVDMALSDAPQDPRALFLRGRILKERGDWAGALGLWAKVTPDDAASRTWAQIWTARVYDLQGRRPEALALYTTIQALPDSRGSRAAASAGIEKPFEDAWPPRVP